MSAHSQPSVGIDHPTVVPANFDPEEDIDSEDDIDADGDESANPADDGREQR
ncbi:hypothetical protein [Halorubrum salsamenti]|jgi:hypothetical protein|uniref:hypothetical protein n=1 Tax=Halorubrum salsamenti TaxID=2583990 RepID=UPI0016428015|nr:hypothetical protein [Halorubrum salsamenti]